MRTLSVTAVTLAAVAGLVGCFGGGAAPVEQRSDAGAVEPDRAEPPCPRELASAASGVGSAQPAPRRPRLAPLRSAWVCLYVPSADTDDRSGGGTSVTWTLRQVPARVAPDDVATYRRLLEQLEPAAAGRTCRLDLGPRYVLVAGGGEGTVGVVVDDFGCQDVRLTDDVFATAPGEPDGGAGTVPGVLEGPTALLRELKASVRSAG